MDKHKLIKRFKKALHDLSILKSEEELSVDHSKFIIWKASVLELLKNTYGNDHEFLKMFRDLRWSLRPEVTRSSVAFPYLYFQNINFKKQLNTANDLLEKCVKSLGEIKEGDELFVLVKNEYEFYTKLINILENIKKDFTPAPTHPDMDWSEAQEHIAPKMHTNHRSILKEIQTNYAGNLSSDSNLLLTDAIFLCEKMKFFFFREYPHSLNEDECKDVDDYVEIISKIIEKLRIERTHISNSDSNIEVKNDKGEKMNQDLSQKQKKIFISHSHKDKEIALQLISIIKSIGVPSGLIFCTSIDGYGVNLGENFLNVIKDEFVKNDIFVLFLLSDSFYESNICLCEMGAAWVMSKKQIPIIIPPFNYSKMNGVIYNIQGIEINNHFNLNQLKDSVESFFRLQSQNNSIWESERNSILSKIDRLLRKYKSDQK